MHAYCSCIAGASGFCNHICALLYQTSHYSKRQLDTVPPDGSKTSVPQTWDKPRIHGITHEPVMSCTVKKVKLDGANSQCIQSNAYEARMKNVIPNDPTLLEEVQKELREENPLYGIVYMATPDTMHMTYEKHTLGSYVPVGSVLSYQLAVSEGNFHVHNNLALEHYSCKQL